MCIFDRYFGIEYIKLLISVNISLKHSIIQIWKVSIKILSVSEILAFTQFLAKETLH